MCDCIFYCRLGFVCQWTRHEGEDRHLDHVSGASNSENNGDYTSTYILKFVNAAE